MLSVRRTHNKGFTLMELLVVMAIAGLLLLIVMWPLIRSFELTRSAQAMVDAQDSVRNLMGQIRADISGAMFIYDNSNTPLMLPVRKLDKSVDTTSFLLRFAKLDMVPARTIAHCNNPTHPAGDPRDFEREDAEGFVVAAPICPVCSSKNVEIRPRLPIEQSKRIVRYFLGLRSNDPTSESFGWHSRNDNSKVMGEENKVVIYRVEFDPRDDRLFSAADSADPGQRLAKPDFFYDPAESITGGRCCDNWARFAQPVGIAKYQDLVRATYQNDEPVTVDPTVSFAFYSVDNESLPGAYSSDTTFSSPDTPPTVFRGKYGYWIPGSSVSVYRNDYAVAYSSQWVTNAGVTHLAVMKHVNSGGTWTSTPDFDITEYLNTGRVMDAPGGDGVVEMGFTIDSNRGTVDFGLIPGKVSATDPSISPVDPAVLNQRFHDVYNGAGGNPPDPGTASRSDLLTTFDPGSPNFLANARVVSGSEKVFGPDMLFPARTTRYQRVPLGLGDPDINQYKMDYETGEIEFSPVYDQDLPEGHGYINVDYKVYFIRNDDIVKATYMTKSVVQVTVGMRLLDPQTGKPNLVNAEDAIPVGNALR